MRTLVVHTGGVGDFLLFCPTLQQLARGSHVELAGNKERLTLAVHAGFAHAAHDLDSIDFAFVFSEPTEKLQTFLRKFDRAIVWMRDDTGELADAVRRCGVPRVETYPGIPPDDWDQHASAWYAHCLELPTPPPLRLPLTPMPPQLDVVIHPGSGSPSKNWLLDRYLEVAGSLEANGRHVTWSLGPAEREHTTFTSLTPALEPMPLTQLARRLAAARLYIGNDSGITHLAAAVDCPTIAIFGPTSPRVWAPIGKHVRLLNWTQHQPRPMLNGILDLCAFVPRR